MKTFKIAVAALCTLPSVAFAADLPATHAPVVVPPPPFSWTGFYIGANLGAGFSPYSDQYDIPGDSPPGLKVEGMFGGGQAGFNYQFSQVVAGIEADFEGSDISDRETDVNFGDNYGERIDYFGTVRGRLGFAFDRVLLYATGGFAYGQIHGYVNGPFLLGSPYAVSTTGTGYAVGGGLEYAFTDNWSAKIEYQYMDLGRHAPTDPAGVATTALPVPGVVHSDAYHTARIGLNYKFGWTPAPVVARY